MNFNSFIKSLSDISERRLMYVLIAIILVIDTAILVLSNGYSGGSYSVMHYQFARWAFSNPMNLLNSWANPFFTLIAAPFAMLGFKSLQLMNIILGILSGYFAYRVAKELRMKAPLLALVICSFTPVFMMTFYGGTTEIMFAFVAILGTFLLIKDKFFAGALVISLLPLIRLDGLILLPVYAIYFIRWRKSKYLPLLLSASVFYSLIGLLFGKNLFWLFDGVKIWSDSIFGHGSFSQFIVRSPGFFGIPNEIFFVTGLVAGLWLYLRERREYSQEFVLVVLPFVIYFLAHSFAWWQGMGNSQGLSRYMAAIVPFMAVMATRGLYLFAKMFFIIFKSEAVRIGALILGFASIIHIPFAIQNYPVSISSTDWALSDAAEYIKVNGLDTKKIYYTDPSIFYFLNKNPKCNSCIEVKNAEQLKLMHNSDLLLFDATFATLKGINFDSVLYSSRFKLMQVFSPETPVQTFGKPYFVALLERSDIDSLTMLENQKIISGANKSYTTLVKYDFDSSTPTDTITVSTSKINRTAYFRIPKRNRNYLVSETKLNTINPIQPISLKVSYRQFRKTSDENLRYFVEAVSNGSTLYKRVFEVGTPAQANPDEWHDISFTLILHNIEVTPELTIRTGFWNKRKGEFLIDDYRVEVAVK
ncbi:MAG: hypothetical protein H5T24_08720 [Bacteroidales bacterium]|nr:hypothetical protein [Bacteroidales bacterium]